MAEQFLGLGKALENIHNGCRRLRLPHDVVNPKRHYGRHVNIKLGNIVLFQARGVKPFLGLAGFGLGKYYTDAYRSEGYPILFCQSRTFRSSESDLPDGLVGSKSDVFSLGCIFLEHITWFLRGLDLYRFAYARLEKDVQLYAENLFFKLKGNKQKTAVIRPAVKRWIGSLKEEEACSWYLIRMLDLIETEMMQVDTDILELVRGLLSRSWKFSRVLASESLPFIPKLEISIWIELRIYNIT
ncbi:unnamed protein product [Clonostachys byssicola]|uniref:Protein kinase domain-containing protein n=1 Tax=Clonostachys byssicola TaxID=160290 RepID=A0A9N9UMD1_9HYPO|nr:unnamed protein product [Clonostachys byssicola]